ncbi:MAG: nuclear transport factor 2 family protein [Hyphomicrobiales bacterium]|nr:nuclear transport factor 2 family protein [Hyphomicrobiales bacterium]
MALKGFHPKWEDFPHYILGITKEIWEDRGIHTLHHYYAKDIVVRSPASIVRGNTGVIAATMATLSEFPDRELLGEDVIWSGSAEGGDLLSSHRLLSLATHANPGVYGAPTGRRLVYRIIADCAARNDQIYDEWLVRDQGAIVRQLGLDPKSYAADLIAREGGPERCVKPFTPEADISGGYHGKGNAHAAGERYAGILTRIMGAELSVVRSEYDRACQLEHPGGRTEHGWAAVDAFWLGLRASFPNAVFTIHHQIGRSDPHMPARAALRWSLDGTHEGWGRFGTPTGARVHIMGLSHAEFGPWGLKREFVLFDESAIWKQILLKTG